MAFVRSGSNLSQIAALLGVSAATVSNALSGKGRVSAELVDKIRATAAEIGYVPSLTGRALRTGRTGVLGLVLPDIANPLFPQIAQAIEFAASSAGYGVLIADSRGSVAMQTDAISRLVERDVDGIVIVPRRGTRITDIGCPVAVIDSPSTPGNTVSADHWQGGQAVVEHLAGLGHRRFLLIGNNAASNVQNDRIGGMKSRLPQGGHAEVMWIERHEAQFGKGGLLGLAERVADGFTAFCAVSDLQALRALTELQRAGIAVPEAASVTGFDDLVWSSVITPGLTTLRMDMATIADIAIKALVRVIETDAAGTAVAADRPSVPMTLVIRQTTARMAASAGTVSNSEPETPPEGERR
ncbi:LacI family DNA-binding transcriptional regulator [Pararhizobium antarcticum]|uniref:LacI family transcriptional regulator n=1 Tax=Pararhizobium antarcticum TaxID=1798805 RepID=A0A657LVU6_9HYPH|nr:LacI family DNA-binding transcriptional regulator [Pararhizobium antarcticum]OJF97555.1 LacI family transcriptional regulator [Rhizobium sp. 58]OJF98921.1 LacI family transcriptional regulator [Pararhizobium antarcticum]OJF98926.1 LacI family transcriptional regulator [Pararhizobium antarcticum]